MGLLIIFLSQNLGSINPCVDHRCNFGGTCEILNNKPVCQCIECSEVYKPVCGSDGITYKYV